MPPRPKVAAVPVPHREDALLTDQEIGILKAAAAILQEKVLPGAGEDAQAPRPSSSAPRRKAATAARRREPGEDPPDREAEILKVAAEVFREKGFAATSIQDIADRVGILKGSLYYYIDNKEDLLYRIGRKVYTDLVSLQEAAAAPDASPLARVRTFIRTHLLHSMNHVAETTAFFGDFRAFSGDRRDEIIGWRDEYETAFRTVIQAGQAEGSIDREIDIRLVSLSAFGMMNSLHLWYQPDGRRSPQEIADTLADLIIRGLATRPE
jgi:TetR/AcrR family transcriptional regulator, cholesterol catabolism regulator